MEAMVEKLSGTIREAATRKAPLRVRGGGSKDFYGGALHGETLDVSGYAGIVDYEPTELVATARAGTRLADLERTLAERGQMLPFEPPHFGDEATLGGCVAAGLSGPRRAYAGAVRDFVLGVRMLDGNGTDLRFGGRVMKNVAGYDVSRLMAGSLGTLGVLLEVSLKVLPLPPAELTLRLELGEADALETMNRWAGRPLPVSATCHHDGELLVRLSGAESALRVARERIGGELLEDAAEFWALVREQRHVFFAGTGPLWRFSVKSTSPALGLQGPGLMEWGGALRWVAADLPAEQARAAAARAGGHATLFRGSADRTTVFHPLAPGLAGIHRRLKQSFDPAGILNPGRMYADL